jgi:glycosyltransferase involved in cell wall biosynthesis
MRIIHLTPGTGNFHCGSCLRDNALIKALRARRHDALMVPLYLPLVTDRDAASPEQPVRVGGISLYLQEKMPWFRLMPRFIHRWLDDPARLRKAASLMGMTSAKDLGRMTVGSLVGQSGNQWAEWQRLITWLKEQKPKPDVISLSNSLLTGLAKALSTELSVPVVCSLQGEDSFLDTLPDPYREQAWAAMRENSQHIARYIAPSQFYASAMAKRLDVTKDKMSVVPNGLDVNAFPAADPDLNRPVIAYLARMIHGKGLTTLVDAFIEIVKRGKIQRLALRIGGAKTSGDAKYVEELEKKLQEAGCAERVTWHPNMTFDEKRRFLRDVTVFSVPATYGEAFGLYLVEAFASGIPVVQPRSGAFPEMIETTGGGLLCEPDDPKSLADALETLLLDPAQREKLGQRGMSQARTIYTSAAMAENFEQVLMKATGVEAAA